MKKLFAVLVAVLLLMPVAWAEEQNTVFAPNTSRVLNYTTSNTIDHTQINAYVNIVRIVTSTDAFVAMASTAPEATTATGMFVPAYTPEYFIRQSGFIAVVGLASAGSAFITEMTR